jgi:hypothetical protein
VTLAQLFTYPESRGYQLDYLKEGEYDGLQWQLLPLFSCRIGQGVVSALPADTPVAWGKDLSEQYMIDHILQMSQPHPEKPFGQCLRDFGINLADFDPDARPE